MPPPPHDGDPWDGHSGATPLSGGDLGLDSAASADTSADGDDSLRTFEAPEAGRYERHGELGRGGMGRVLHARDGRLGRDVALKELRAGRSARRLAREARITARLDHPGIVPVYDAGIGPDGTPFYTMGLVRGRSLADVLAEDKSAAGRLSLLRRVLEAAQAVAYAHSQGVVHRDLKPANIMLGAYGETQVVDWGLATLGEEAAPGRRPAGQETLAPGVTAEGAVLGTPAYMSPEQAAGERGDARSDVWSLGIILFELVAGAPPFHADESDTVLRRLRTEQPPTPEGPRELTAIIGRALQRDPAARYPDAGELAADLSSYIDGREVEAYDYTPWELLLRLVQAWRVPLGVGAVAALLLAGTAAVLGARNAAERDRAVAAERESRVAKAAADAALARALTSQAGAALQSGDRARAEVLATHALSRDESPEARGVLAALARQPRPRREAGEPLPECDRRLVGDAGAWLLCGTEQGLSRWSGRPLTQDWQRVLQTNDLVATGDGRVLLRSEDLRAELLDGTTGDPLPDRPRISHPAKRGWTQVFDGTGGLLYESSAQESLAAHDLRHDAPGVLVEPTRIDACRSLLAAPIVSVLPEARAAVLCEDGALTMLDDLRVAHRTERVVPVDLGAPSSAVASPDGRTLIAGTLGGHLLEIDLESHRLTRAVDLGRGIISSLRIAPDGATLVVKVERPGVLLWDRARATELFTLPAPRGAEARFEDEHTVAVYTDRVTRWHLPEARLAAVLHTGDGITSARLSPDGTRVATADGGGHGRVWSMPEGRRISAHYMGPGVLKWAAFSPDSGTVAFAGMTAGGVVLVDARTGEREQTLTGLDAALRRVAWLSDRRLLGLGYSAHPAVYARDEEAVRQSMATGWDLFRSPAGAVVVSGEDGISMFDAGTQRRILSGPRGFVTLSPDGRTVAATNGDTLELYAPDGTADGTLRPGGPRLQDVAFSPDGRWLAAGDLAGDIWIWRWPDRALAGRLRAHAGRIASVEFSTDGETLLSGSWDQTARLWDLTTLDADPEVLRAEAEAAWGLDLAGALEEEAR